ncbi:deubiquitinase OTUD6B [Onthophagus taurus]|uniref:deubiquitinase OTUD6B n=1 Tax=Onthophagus taurus TaxID=166361 RepID=UPI0039BE1828
MSSSENEMEGETMLKRHRQERKDLQAKIQALKKSAPKGDKKKKKEIQDMITQLEKELDDKHNLELKSANITDCQNSSISDDHISTQSNDTISPSSSKTSRGSRRIRNQDDTEGDVGEDENEEEEPMEPVKITRAQKRRNKKQEEDKEREKRIQEQDEVNSQGPRVIEMQTIKEILTSNNLDIFDIAADGNCLYCAINHQLVMTGREPSTTGRLRKQTADFMREHKDDFIPFMYNETEQAVDDKQFENYCKKVEKTKLWGGQLELRALSNVLQCPIKVIQASGPSTIQGENFQGAPLVLVYHRHLYKLGEHYNSTVCKEQ